MSSKTWLLSIADQVAPRSTVRIVLCFPYSAQKNDQTATINRLKHAVLYVLNLYPFLAGNVVLMSEPGHNNGHVYVETGPCATKAISQIFFVKDCLNQKHLDYSKLRTTGFSAESLRSEDIAPASAKNTVDIGAPVFLTQLNFTQNGLLLAIYLQHSVCDAWSVNKVLEALAVGTTLTEQSCLLAQPADVTLMEPVLYRPIPYLSQEEKESRIIALFAKVASDLCRLEHPHGPCSNRRPVIRTEFRPIEAAIFTFDDLSLRILVDQCNKNPAETKVSRNDCVGAIIWAYTVVARLPDHCKNNELSKILIPVNYRSRITPSVTARYFGNAVTFVTAQVTVQMLLNIARQYTGELAVEAITEVAREIKKAINKVTGEYVCDRNELSELIYDVRHLGVNFCSEDNLDVQFNTWANIGVDTRWDIPGVHPNPVNPESIRKGHETHRHGANLILPRSHNSKIWEVVVQLETPAMERLRGDSRFVNWVSAEIG